MGVARWKADRDGDEADLGDSGRDAVRVGEDQWVDDRALIDGAAAAARAQFKRGPDADQEDQTATDAVMGREAGSEKRDGESGKREVGSGKWEVGTSYVTFHGPFLIAGPW